MVHVIAEFPHHCPKCGWSSSEPLLANGTCVACATNPEINVHCGACNAGFMQRHLDGIKSYARHREARCVSCVDLPFNAIGVVMMCGHFSGCDRRATVEIRRLESRWHGPVRSEDEHFLLRPSREFAWYCGPHSRMAHDHLTNEEIVTRWQAWGFACFIDARGGIAWAFDAGDIPAQWRALFQKFEIEDIIAMDGN